MTVALALAACGATGSAREPTPVPAPPTGTTTVVANATTTTTPPATPTTTLPATTTTTLPATTTTVLPTGPSVVLALGDSVMYDFAPGLAAMFGANGSTFVDGSLFGLGFSFVDYDWRGAAAARLADAHPELVVFLAGAWDARSVVVAGRRLAYGSPEWAQWYDGEMDALVALVHEAGARLVWLTPLPNDPGHYDGDLAPVLGAVVRLPQRSPDVAVVDSAAAIGAPGGGFARYLPGPEGTPEEVRKPDGIHLCPAGAGRLAAAVAPAVAAWWAFAPAPGWEAGAWRADDRYLHPLHGRGCTG